MIIFVTDLGVENSLVYTALSAAVGPWRERRLSHDTGRRIKQRQLQTTNQADDSEQLALLQSINQSIK